MSLLKGAVSFVEFEVAGDLPESPLGFIGDRIRAMGFRDIDDTFDEYSIGWVSILNMFDHGSSNYHPIVGDYAVASMRIDQRSIPGAVLRKFVEKEEQRIKAEKQIPKISRVQRVEIKERIRTELVRKAKPAPLVVDMAWNLSTGHVFLFSTNKSAQAVFEDLFKETFGVSVQRKEYPEADEFLTWLWWQSMTEGTVDDVNMVRKVLVSDGTRKVSCAGGIDVHFPEALVGVGIGKIVNTATIDLTPVGGDRFSLSLSVPSFEYRSVKLPKIGITGDGASEEDGLIYERIYLFESLTSSINGLFAGYIEVRESPEWDGKMAIIREWAGGDEVTE